MYWRFAFTALEAHKTLRQVQGGRDKTAITPALDNLETYITVAIDNALDRNFQLLLDYFAVRVRATPLSPQPPRIALKLIVPPEDKTSGYEKSIVFTRKRSGKELRKYKSQYPLETHSVFLDILRTGEAQVVQDIPERCGNGPYRNARLDPGMAKAYFDRRCEGEISDAYPDEPWIACWKDEHPKQPRKMPGQAHATSCYKSTLVIPVTLVGHIKALLDGDIEEQGQDIAFVKEFAEKVGASEVAIERFLLGFLCLDHVDRNYFEHGRSSNDMHLGYMVADMISLYILLNMVLWDYSETVKEAKTILSEV